MIGQYQHNIDAKGRLFIPVKYREELGDAFYVTIGLDGCLSVYSNAKWAELTAKFDALPLSKARSMRTLFANAAKCEPDSQGRILIPAKLRKYAALEKEVIINGASKCLELWNPERWAAIEEAGLDPENLAAAMEELGFRAACPAAQDKPLEHDKAIWKKDYGHKPVLLEECMQALAIHPDGVYLDGTLGRGGHSLEILRRLKTGRLIGIDRDMTAICAARERLAAFQERVTLVHGNFCDLDRLLQDLGVGKVDGMLFDLGVSSPQLDEPHRGFSYMHDAPLDMRMDESAALNAYEIVNTWPQEELRRILYEYGEERYAPQIARGIVRRRERGPIQTTGELTDVIRSAMPAAALREKQHPAKRSFQALRIAVNGELDALPPMLEAAACWLKPGGRLAVITFHSLEDRIVKQSMRTLAAGCTCPPQFPVCVCGKKPVLKLLTRKPVVPGQQELAENPRARSAKLRTAERTAFHQ